MTTTAQDILDQAASEMRDRAKTYDSPQGERSMGKTVAAFGNITGVKMSEQQGWQFMAVLKMVRTNQGGYRADSFVDGACYDALAGESAKAEHDRQMATHEQDDLGYGEFLLPDTGSVVQY